MSGPTRVVLKPRPDATPEGEAAALAAVYSFILRAAASRTDTGKESAADVTGIDGDDAKEGSKGDIRARTIIPERPT